MDKLIYHLLSLVFFFFANSYAFLIEGFRCYNNIRNDSKGWGRAPGENDTQIADDIERVRLYQNKICHANSSEMTTVDFNESVLDLIGVHVIFKLLFK